MLFKRTLPTLLIKAVILYFIAFATLLFSSCEKGSTFDPYTIPNNIKGYWNFKPGTYWVYKDSVTSKIDSVYVTSFSDDTTDDLYYYSGTVLPGHYSWEQVTLITQNTSDTFQYNYSSSAIDGNFFVEAKQSKQYNNSAVNYCFVYPLSVGNSYSDPNYNQYIGICIIKAVYSEYNNFNSVVEVYNPINSSENNNGSESFYAMNVGLIRYVVPATNTVRNLVSYHIVQ